MTCARYGVRLRGILIRRRRSRRGASARNAFASSAQPCDGVSVQLERYALKGYGNAIVPQVAAAFIDAYLSVT